MSDSLNKLSLFIFFILLVGMVLVFALGDTGDASSVEIADEDDAEATEEFEVEEDPAPDEDNDGLEIGDPVPDEEDVDPPIVTPPDTDEVSTEDSDLFYKNGKPYTGVFVQERYENGNPKAEWDYKDGKRHGALRCWYENGQIEYEKEYKNDKQHGSLTMWYENGKVMFKTSYTNDVHDRAGVGWYSDGTHKYNAEYVGATELGVLSVKEWHPNGFVSCEMEYKFDEVTSERRWNEEGQELFKDKDGKWTLTEKSE